MAIVKKTLGIKKAGHTGTLDPLATGVLPVCLNEATKLSRFLSCETKVYRATMLLGVETDTLDTQGRILAKTPPEVREADIEKALARFVGPIDQKPPEYSAVKYQGKALYKWARKGIVIDSAPRRVEVYRLTLEDVALPYVTFSISCSAGTYIRSICADVGKGLGCGACLSGLRRLSSGAFQLAAAVHPEDVQGLKAGIISMPEALSHLPALYVSAQWEKKLRDGVQPDVGILNGYDISFLVPGDMVKFLSGEGRLVAIASLECSKEGDGVDGNSVAAIKILRIFHDQ